MNLRRSLCSIALSALSMVLLVSCDKEASNTILGEEPRQEQATLKPGPVIDLSLEAIVGGDNLRALQFDQVTPGVGNVLQPTVPAAGVDVLCIIKSSDPADQPVYRMIHWEKHPTKANRIRLHKHRFQFPNGYATASGKTWYIMGVIGGVWNEASKTLSMSSNAITSIDESESINLDVPAFSKWVEIPTEATGEFIFQEDGRTVVYSEMPFHTQGALEQHRIKSSTSDFDLDITSFRVVSTAFSFEGSFNLSQLPPVDNSALGHKHSGLFPWTPSGASTQKEYVDTNRGVTEYTRKFALPAGSSISVAKGGNANAGNVSTFWVMPTGVEVGKARTNVFVEATASEGKGITPKVVRLPAYGKNHTVVLRSGDLAKLVSVLHRPKLPIEYMAEYNVKGRNDTQVTGVFKNFASTAEFATNHGLEASSRMRWQDAKNHGIAGYHLPTPDEFAGIVPHVQNGGGSYVSLAGQVGTQNKKQVNVSVNGRDAVSDFHMSVDQTNKVCYAIHWTEGNNRMQIAYRYSWVENEDQKPYIGTNLFTEDIYLVGQTGKVIRNKKYYDDKNKRYFWPAFHTPNPETIKWANDLKIEAIYLGPHFLGTVDDIANEAWWNEAERRGDIITRRLSAQGGSISYSYRTGGDPSYDIDRVASGGPHWVTLYPFVISYWLDNKTDVLAKASTTEYLCTLFNLSPYNGLGNVSSMTRPEPVCYSVRLFSDN